MGSEWQDGIVDLYKKFDLDKNANYKTLRTQIQKIQGMIISDRAAGCLNNNQEQKRLNEVDNLCKKAIKIFRNEESKKEYDKLLAKAYKKGTITTATNEIVAEFVDELKELTNRCKYTEVIRKCIDALVKGVVSAEILSIMARAYFASGDSERSVRIIEYGLEIYPADIDLVRLGARYAIAGMRNSEMSQSYIDRLVAMNAPQSIICQEQIYWYLYNGRERLAYDLIDSYVEEHPYDNDFRRDCALDLIGHSYKYYDCGEDGTSVMIASKRAYQYCVATCRKAVSLFDDENTRKALADAEFYGTKKFNPDHLKEIALLMVQSVMFLAPGTILFWVSLREGFLVSGGDFLVLFILSIIFLYFGIKLREVSYRPYWQINKYFLTGEMEDEEKKFVAIGRWNLNSFKWSFKITMFFMVFIIGIIDFFKNDD